MNNMGTDQMSLEANQTNVHQDFHIGSPVLPFDVEQSSQISQMETIKLYNMPLITCPCNVVGTTSL